MDGPNSTNPDPLLKPGAFINPNPKPTSNGNGKSKREPARPKQPTSDQKTGSSVDVTEEINRPDWLPSGWTFKEFLRTSGASAGTKDKYFIDPVTSRRFRSKKEVFRYLENGTTPQQKRKADSDVDNTLNTETPKRKKSEAKPKVSIKNFNFDDIPEKVKWVLTDSFASTWKPKINGVDIVSELSYQEWRAAFTYLTLQDGDGKATV